MRRRIRQRIRKKLIEDLNIKQKGKYLIGGRFLVECGRNGFWSLKDDKNEWHRIFSSQEIDPLLINVYKGDDVYWIFNRVPLLFYEEGEGYLVIKGNEIVSHIVLEADEFSINHYGQKFKGRIRSDKRVDIVMNKDYVAVLTGKEGVVYFEYKVLGDKVTPLIGVRGDTGKVVCFPEFSKVYSGLGYSVKGGLECLNVCVYKDKMSHFYVLLKNGEEHLVYEGPELYASSLPTFHRLGDIMVVALGYGEEKKIVKDFRQIPGFKYLYVMEDEDKNLYISFNLGNWEKVGKVDGVIFKGSEGRIMNRPLYFQSYSPSEALDKFAKEVSEVQTCLNREF